ncbi:MAG TPA: hypothetical protein VKA36_02765 [Solirubrobacterales bacterium]|nr:hypothetical protein [Solirubrobacterales bacterium]
MNDGNGPTQFRERLELWSALLLAAATVATAYSAYESTRWSGQQSTDFTSAGASRTESAKAQSNGASFVTIDAALFTEWASALSNGNKRLQKAYEDRFFRKEFKPAFEEWLASKPEKNPDAENVPFTLDSYQPEELVRADELEEEASAKFESGREANQTSDNYVLSTIFFAAVLFFAGIATKFTSDRIVAVSLGAGTVVFVLGVIRLATLPFL